LEDLTVPSKPKPSAGRPKGTPTAGRRDRAAAQKAAQARYRRIRVGVIAGAVIAVLAVIGLAVAASSGGASGVADPTRFDLPAFHGPGRVRLTDFRGKPVVVNMFASWCTVCRGELPGFTSEARRLAGKVLFVEVNSQETGNGTAMANDFGLAGAGMVLAKDVGPSPASQMHDALGAQGMPVSVFYDAQGHILEHDNGGILEPDLGTKLHQFYGV
jgi:thiol-disulfide isomerase/thioredoxin